MNELSMNELSMIELSMIELSMIKCPVSEGRDWMLNNIINIDKYISDKIDQKEDLKDNLDITNILW